MAPFYEEICQGAVREAFECAPTLVGVNVVRPVGRSTLTPPARRRGVAPVPGHPLPVHKTRTAGRHQRRAGRVTSFPAGGRREAAWLSAPPPPCGAGAHLIDPA
jgi:hypothetical protein